MRIISGKYRGKIVQVHKSFKARPTTDYSKESLFGILHNTFQIEEMKVLDLFSGTGSISYEFASRGCENVTSVEINNKYASFIKRTSDALSLKIKVINCDAIKYIKKCNEKFNIIFADPPYDMKDIDLIPDYIFDNSILDEEGVFILEHSKDYFFSENKFFFKHKTYGAVNFSFFQMAE
ncbi:MAG: RsmD family RNA methyltransferase [Bacteroidota bacterium]